MTIEQYDSLYQIRNEIRVLEKEIAQFDDVCYMVLFKKVSIGGGMYCIKTIDHFPPDKALDPKPSPFLQVIIEQLKYHANVRLIELKKEFEEKSRTS